MHSNGFNTYKTALEAELSKKISKITRIRNPHYTIDEIKKQQKKTEAELRRTEREVELYQQQLTKLDYYLKRTKMKL